MQKKEEHMGKHKALQGAIAAFASVATLGALAVPALADSASTYSPNGKSVAELAQHGGAQRIAAIGNKSAKNVVLFIGDGMGDSEITVARNYLKGVNGHFDGLDAVGQPGALDDVEAGTGQYTTFSLGSNSSDSAVGKDGKGNLNANSNPGKITAVTTPPHPVLLGQPVPRPTTTRWMSTCMAIHSSICSNSPRLQARRPAT